MLPRSKLLKTPRTQLNYIPQWKGSVEGYVTNFLTKNFWKVESTMTYDDAYHEAFIVYLRLRNKYSVKEAKHFMALFKTALSRTFIDLAKLNSELASIKSLQADEEGDTASYEPIGDLDTDAHALIALRQAPSEIKQVLNLLLSAPLEILELAREAWLGNKHNAIDGNNFINAALGREQGTDSIGAVRQYFM